jgi:hypothetical protein
MDNANVTTALELPGKKIVKNIGLARSITVRSRSFFCSINAGLQTILGGNVALYTKLREKAREEAYEERLSTPKNWVPTPLSPCATTPMSSVAASPRFSATARRGGRKSVKPSD